MNPFAGKEHYLALLGQKRCRRGGCSRTDELSSVDHEFLTNSVSDMTSASAASREALDRVWAATDISP